MRKMLLTSAGFENEHILSSFLALADKAPQDIRTAFVPTAAIDQEAKAVLPKCWFDLFKAGIAWNNITIYDLDRPSSPEILDNCDAVYVCGGDTRHLLSRINQTTFDKALNKFLNGGGVYVGVSAGSVAAASNLEGNLEWFPYELRVHCQYGTPLGDLHLPPGDTVSLTNDQAVLIVGERRQVIGKA